MSIKGDRAVKIKIIVGVGLLVVATGFYISYSQESNGVSSSVVTTSDPSVAPAQISDTVSQMLQDETVPRNLSVAPTEPVVAPEANQERLVTATQAAGVQEPETKQTIAPAITPTTMQIATPTDGGAVVTATGAASTVVTPEMEAAEISAQALPSDTLMPSMGVVTEAAGTTLPQQTLGAGAQPVPGAVGLRAETPAEMALPTAISETPLSPEVSPELSRQAPITRRPGALPERQGPTLEQVVAQAAQEKPLPIQAGLPGELADQLGAESPEEPEERVYRVEQPEVAPGVVDIEQELPAPSIEDDGMVFDEKAKRQAAESLVKHGIDYFNTHSMAQACHAFTHTKEFWRGELYLFLISYDGTIFAHGQQKDLLWKNLYELRDSFGTPVVQAIINGAKRGGGWVTYSWRNATKISYVQEVKKDGKLYAIGAGYYPHSKVDAVVTMVKGAVAFFNQTMKTGKRVEDAFSPLSYPIGRFVYGDLYLYALDFKGTNLAHGARPGLIGTNSWNYKDAQGRLVNQEIIQQLKMTDKGVWIEYVSGGARKRAYAEKVTDTKGNNYFIACGYYIDAGRKEVVDLVRKGYQFMKTHGVSAAAEEFSDIRRPAYRHGDLYLVVYDMNGKVIAHGGNPEFIGRNHYDDKDESGRHYVRELIQKGRDGGGWVDIKMKNSFQSVYVEKVELGIDSFIVTCGVYPVSKYETMELLAKAGLDYLEMGNPKDVFAEFVDKEGKFVRGDLSLFVFDTDGICYAYGDDNSLIWHNLINVTDDKGVAFVQQFINTVKQGANMVRYTLNGVEKIGYISSVQKDGKIFIVGSSYYR